MNAWGEAGDDAGEADAEEHERHGPDQHQDVERQGLYRHHLDGGKGPVAELVAGIDDLDAAVEHDVGSPLARRTLHRTVAPPRRNLLRDP